MESIDNSYQNKLNNSSIFETLFKIIFKDCPDGYIYKDFNLKYKYANNAFCKIFELNNIEKVLNDNEIPCFSEENKKLINDVTSSVAKDLHSISYIMNFKGDSEEKILSITTTPVLDNETFLGIITLVKDITYEEKIKENFVFKHFQLKSLLENLPLIIYMQDNELNYITGTKHSKIFLKNGYDAFSNIELNIDLFDSENLKESRWVLENKQALIKEKQIYDNKGFPHWYRISKFPISEFNKKGSGLITFAENIDSDKQLQNQKETFVATLSHDLKNPTIAQIRGLELLLKGDFGELNANQKELLEMILDSCRYMNGMLASLLTTYRNLDGIIRLHFEEFSFADLVGECISEMIYVAKDKDIHFLINSNTESDTIIADRTQIKRVVMNLLSNGIKYAFKNTKLKIRINIDDDITCFEFENESPFIPLEKQQAIFAQYVSYASNYNEAGIGLGLYASKKIIESHQGKVFFESFTDNKNKFGFRIPTIPKPECYEKDICF